MTIEQGIDQIRRTVSKIEGDERSVLEALISDLADGWEARLQELENSSDDDDDWDCDYGDWGDDDEE